MREQFQSYVDIIKGPFKRVSSFFGYRKAFRTSTGRMSSSNHTGIDLPASRGSTVPAMEDGIIEKIVRNPAKGFGNYVVLRHADGSKSLYAHLSSFDNIREGMQIKKGTRLGGVGATGDSKGNHLHFTLYSPNGKKINPLSKYSLNDFNRLAIQGSASQMPAVAQQEKPYTHIQTPPSSFSLWWKMNMPHFLGGWSDMQRNQYQQLLKDSEEIFKGVTRKDLKTNGFSEQSIDKMRNIGHGLLGNLKNAEQAHIRYADFRENGFSKEEIRKVMNIAYQKNSSDRMA